MKLLLLVLLFSVSLSLVFGAQEDREEYIKAAEKLGFEPIKYNENRLERNHESARKSRKELKKAADLEIHAGELNELEVEGTEENFGDGITGQKRESELIDKTSSVEGELDFDEIVRECQMDGSNPKTDRSPYFERKSEEVEDEEYKHTRVKTHKLAKSEIVAETIKLLVALVLFRISALAAAEIFPGYPSEVSQAVDKLATHAVTKRVSYYLNCRYVFEAIMIIVPTAIFFFAITTRFVEYLRKLTMSLSFSFLAVALCDMLLEFLRSFAPKKYYQHYFTIVPWIEYAVACAAFMVVLSWNRFLFEALLSAAGCFVIIAFSHFLQDGKFSLSFEFFNKSNFTASVHSDIETAKNKLAIVSNLVSGSNDSTNVGAADKETA